jgi:hypothetical protein
LEPPEGEINYLAIIENDDKPVSSRQLLSPLSDGETQRHDEHSYNNQISHRTLEGLPIGRGWSLDGKPGDRHCNGTWDSQCGRGPGEPCLLYGHNDGRGGLMFDSFSGWMVLRFTIKEGIIFIKFDTWYPPEAAGLTKGWTEENNGATRRDLSDMMDERHLAEMCPDLLFEYSVNGKITTLTKDEFLAQKKQVQRVVETLTILDDPNFTSGKEMEVEFGVRIRGCQRITTFHLTHVYWA